MLASKLLSASSASKYYLAVSSGTSPYVAVYPWDSDTGFGAKYSNPSTIPTSYCNAVKFSPSGSAVVVGMGLTPYVAAYQWTSSGFGTKYSNPASLPAGQVYEVAFSPQSDAIMLGYQNSPYASAYPWSYSSGFGTKFSNPGTAIPQEVYGIDFHPDGNFVALSGFLNAAVAYGWSSAGFGSVYTSGYSYNGYAVKFSPAGNAIFVAHTTAPYISAWEWSGSGFGTKYTSYLYGIPTGNGRGVSVTKTASHVLVGTDTSPSYNVFEWDYAGNGFGVKTTNSSISNSSPA